MASPQQAQSDPYAEFGGAASVDPYAEFGGSSSNEPLSMRQRKGGFSGTMPPRRYSDIIGPSGGPGAPGEAEAATPVTAKGTLTPIAEGTVAAGTALAAGPAVSALAPVVARHPLLSQMVGSALISQARRIPYVGKMIPPYAEMAPFFFGGKGEAAAAEEAAPTLTEQMSAPETPPGSATWQRPLPAPEAVRPSAPPTASAARPSLSEQMESAQPERRVSQQPYTGPNRRIAPEERGFMTAPPLDPERIGVDYRPAEDLGVKVRQETEAAKGPIKRGGKALGQAKALSQPSTSNKLIQNMGSQPVETVTGERPPYVPLGFREGPPPGTIVPQSSEEMQSALDMSLRRAKRGRILPND